MSSPDAAATVRRRLRVFVVILVLAHCAFGLARVPHAVVMKRWREVAACQKDGEVAFVLRSAHMRGADAIETLRATTPDDALVAVRGWDKGVLEFAPALLWPRLCMAEGALPRAAPAVNGRPIAPFVLVAEGDELRLETR